MGNSSKLQNALSDGRLTASEIRNLTSAGIGMDKVIRAAGDQGATISTKAQRTSGISQNKDTGLISYTPALAPGAYGIGGAAAPQPGSGFVVTGQQGYQTNDPASGSTNNLAPTYTYMGGGVQQGGSSGGGNNQTPLYPGLGFSSGGGPNNIGPTRSGIGPNVYTTSTATTQPTAQNAPGPMQSWLDSLGIGIQSYTDAINKLIADNQESQKGYAAIIDNLVNQMSAGNQQMFSGPYAVTTQGSVPVMGAQTTQAINRRQRISNTSLSIRPETTSAGTGLNIAA